MPLLAISLRLSNRTLVSGNSSSALPTTTSSSLHQRRKRDDMSARKDTDPVRISLKSFKEEIIAKKLGVHVHPGVPYKLRTLGWIQRMFSNNNKRTYWSIKIIYLIIY
ncbi:unnamed protein product [Cuscuta epithymum]|uniref:Uncharacterized protein n=1 Tax=Cuscuta epithymum TaxID=186058 RepID=A0AAV0CYF1_9ASTE|nr:unnamed protein product [Cuscuta epithymum]